MTQKYSIVATFGIYDAGTGIELREFDISAQGSSVYRAKLSAERQAFDYVKSKTNYLLANRYGLTVEQLERMVADRVISPYFSYFVTRMKRCVG